MKKSSKIVFSEDLTVYIKQSQGISKNNSSTNSWIQQGHDQGQDQHTKIIKFYIKTGNLNKRQYHL